jgi:hypothetical protein
MQTGDTMAMKINAKIDGVVKTVTITSKTAPKPNDIVLFRVPGQQTTVRAVCQRVDILQLKPLYCLEVT